MEFGSRRSGKSRQKRLSSPTWVHFVPCVVKNCFMTPLCILLFLYGTNIVMKVIFFWIDLVQHVQWISEGNRGISSASITINRESTSGFFVFYPLNHFSHSTIRLIAKFLLWCQFHLLKTIMTYLCIYAVKGKLFAGSRKRNGSRFEVSFNYFFL